MPTYSLNNTSAEINCTISETYCRLTGSYAGPLTASLVSNSGFLIQNGNKQTGLFVGNSCFIFGNNILDFSKNCQNFILKIPSSCNFLISGQSSGQSLNFKSDGSLMLGYSIDSTYLGLEINNYCPNLILTDINQNQNQTISFRNSSGDIFAKFFNNPSASINSGSSQATQISYNKNLIIGEYGCTPKIFLSGNYFSIGFNSCLNTGYNFSVSGSGYFSCSLCTPTLIANNGYFNDKLYINGNGYSPSIEICNTNYFGIASINFYNSSGSLYNRITSSQDFLNGASELNFYTTPTGLYGPFERCELALKISGDKSATFYGNICSETGNFSYVKTNELNNLGSKSYLNTGINGQHCLMLNNSFIYSYCSISGFITDHAWYTSGNNISMCMNRFGNLINIGSIFSHSGLCTTGSLCVNNNELNSCIVSKCIILSGNGNFCNVNLYGNVQTCGTFENNSLSQAKFFGICSTGSGNNIISGNLFTCNNICTSGVVCSISCIQSSSCGIFNQGIASNSWICAQDSGIFGSAICVLGTTNTNCFCSSLDVKGSVNANNTAKAWGIYGLNNNSTPTLTGLNIKSINIYQNSTPLIYAYGICFNNPITYPFVVNFNVYSSGNALITENNSNLQNGESLGFSGVSSTSTHLGSSSATVAYPFSVQFYALSGKRSSDNTFAAYSAGTSYSEIYFNLANQDGPTTNYADLTRANAHGIIHFSIFGQ